MLVKNRHYILIEFWIFFKLIFSQSYYFFFDVRLAAFFYNRTLIFCRVVGIVP